MAEIITQQTMICKDFMLNKLLIKYVNIIKNADDKILIINRGELLESNKAITKILFKNLIS